MLPFDDPRWSDLHAEGANAAEITHWLRQLLETPDDLTLLTSHGWMLCSQEITWSAAFAAAPYLMEACRRAQPAAQIQFVRFLGSIAKHRIREPETSCECPRDLEADFQVAILAALQMALVLFPLATQEPEVRDLLSAMAAFKGLNGLARGITDLVHEDRHDTPAEDIAF